MEIGQEWFKEVDFEKYCKTCKHKDVNEVDEPCDSCILTGARLYSTEPIKYEKSK